MKPFDHYRDLFAVLYGMVKTEHTISPRPHAGHGLDHDAAVAMMGILLAGTDETAAEMVFVAALVHSTDRFVEEGHLDATLNLYLSLLPIGHFNDTQVAEIKEAVLRHTEFKDRDLETRKPTQCLLMDADKLVNLNLLLVARSGQLQPNIPAIEMQFVGGRNPLSTYRKPTSIIEDLHGSLEWLEPGWLHSPTARVRADVLGAKLRQYIEDAEAMFVELGLAGVEL
jgi:hypothetical protein